MGSRRNIELLFSNPIQHMPAKHAALFYFWMIKIADMLHANSLHYFLRPCVNHCCKGIYLIKPQSAKAIL